MSTSSTTAESGLTTCARCGHTAPTCERCGRATQFLGGMIGGEWYCHTFVAQPSCYTQALRGGDVGFRVNPREGSWR